MSKDPYIYLGHILESIADIESYLADLSEEAFLASSEKQSAITWKLVVIGESVANLPEEFKSRYPDVPWAQIKAARNILVHEYFRLDVQEIWRMATTDLPALKRNLRAILNAS
ncbi:MAG: DUF86 domain-containing protein [Desulfarculus sp.]|nr:DUF86 domain-containing protein [Desulfarculus sp.]